VILYLSFAMNFIAAVCNLCVCLFHTAYVLYHNDMSDQMGDKGGATGSAYVWEYTLLACEM